MEVLRRLGVEEQHALIHLNRVPGLGSRSISRLIDRFGSAAAALRHGPLDWEGLLIRRENCEHALSQDHLEQSQREIDRASTLGVQILTWADSGYPESLRQIDFSPPVLYARGDLSCLDDSKVLFGIVGSRSPTPYGKMQSERFAKALAELSVVIVSGFARGIDTAAHIGALNAGGQTIAVLAGGLDKIYPQNQDNLLSVMERRGLLLSEFPFSWEPLKRNFPLRNRIISGLCKGVLVVEAAEKSGSLITAHWAADQGRDVYAIPGRIDHPMSRGCHFLIREGAQLVDTPDQILEELALQKPSRPECTDLVISPILDLCGQEPLTVEELARRLQKPLELILDQVLEYEIDGRLRRCPGGRFMRIN